MKYLAYIVVAAVLGLTWYAALLIPDVTRQLLLRERLFFSCFSAGGAVILAVVFRKHVARTTSAERIAGFAIGLPILAAVLAMWGLTLRDWIGDGGPDTFAGALARIAVIGVGTTVVFSFVAFYVVIPMGLLTTFVLRQVGKRLWPEFAGDGQPTKSCS